MFFRRRKYVSLPKTTNSNESIDRSISSRSNENVLTKSNQLTKEISSSSSAEKDLNGDIASSTEEFIKSITKKLHSPADLVTHYVNDTITVVFLENLIKEDVLNEKILPRLQYINEETPSIIQKILPLPQVTISDQLNMSIDTMLTGAVIIHIEGYSQIVLAKIPTIESRTLSTPENESQVIGSQVGFNESISTNISLIRRYIMNPNLCNEKTKLGKQTNTNITLLYIDGIATEQNVNTVRQRIKALDIEDLLDSAVLAELIDDSSLSIFPQMLLTERPDRFCDGLLSGKVGILVDGSSMGILCPYSFFEFFHSREDKNLRWPVATFIRLLRFAALFISIFFTPMYVASLTYHYEVIPQPLLVPLSESRAIVPFPPILEALFLELIIELLREAGARLPSKIGQTIGIVGGIVLGTAAVQAGITSNILIIIIALCALSSFTTPNYLMGNVIRVLRFPIILLAGFWGYYGIILAFCFLLIHLLRQTSLGAPYMSPFYPPRFKSWGDSIIRLPNPFVIRKSPNARVNNSDIPYVSTTIESKEK
ncbi:MULTISPECIES: spore germination protein [unclassified Lysinibacillus]|uniref:spore germination protein n=1 Tax=unclassified Lysinibacillus TaxID=2636778 RepID=UPI00381B15B8